MPDLLTPQVLASAGPLVLETFIKHFLTGKKEDQEGNDTARVELLYDEAYVLMKTFLEIATKHPVAALQKFGLTRTPTPPWVAVHRLIIPQSSLTPAAEYLIKGFGGEDMAYKVAGGTKWWQVRAGPGVEAEWIVMKREWRQYLDEEKARDAAEKGKKKVKEDQNHEGEFLPEMDRLRCMLYIHGGAYYWGSINTHRYTIWRYARKMRGRCFAVNYRKAPQYPFPCAIQDCLAAWLYLVRPPPEAKHRPVDPKNIVIAGDSAGGGLVWALLQILRDTEGLDLPAGAVLISPWSDLTHSFPSILSNTATDIVPPYSFIHKPSSLWPPPPPALTDEMQTRMRSRVKDAVARFRTHRSPDRTVLEPMGLGIPLIREPVDEIRTSHPEGGISASHMPTSALHPTTTHTDAKPQPSGEPHRNPSRANPAAMFDHLATLRAQGGDGGPQSTTLARCEEPLRLEVEGEHVAIDTQIQLYATNAQLCHPWVSPVLGYLGGLPPLLIIAGNNEVLRDEIIYAAHKAAHPEKHPIRDDVKKLLPSLNCVEDRYASTNVHLQVYDGACHDLPLFSMTKPARGAFRAIASFSRFVTPSAPSSLSISQSRPVSGFATPRSAAGPSGDGTILQKPYMASPPTSPITMSPPLSPMISPSFGPRSPGLTPTMTPLGSTIDLVGTSVPPPRPTESMGSKFDSPRHASFSEGLPLKKSGAETPPDRRQSIVRSFFQRRMSSNAEKSTGTNTEPSPTKNSFGAAAPLDDEDSRLLHSSVTGQMPIISSLRRRMSNKSDRSSGLGDPSGSGASDPDVQAIRAHLRALKMEPSASGDDAGPRFGEDPADKDSKALPGTAGHSGIYRGPNPFADHMIRERVAFDGTCRPLEPETELGAMTMPADEIGFIKEGPAMRYVNGQALWDRKFRHTRKTVARHRERNLKATTQQDAKRIVKLWQDKVRSHDEAELAKRRRAKSLAPGQSTPVGSLLGAGPGVGSEAASGYTTTESDWEDHDESTISGREKLLLDRSWSWTWALKGEAPPPSAIVSRRDFEEARRLALIADRMDEENSSELHGLSIWVMLATFFSNSQERNKAHDALREVKRNKDEEKKASAAGGTAGKRRTGGNVGPIARMGSLFSRKRQAEDAPETQENKVDA